MKNLRSKGETLRFRSRVTNITFKLDRPLAIASSGTYIGGLKLIWVNNLTIRLRLSTIAVK